MHLQLWLRCSHRSILHPLGTESLGRSRENWTGCHPLGSPDKKKEIYATVLGQTGPIPLLVVVTRFDILGTKKYALLNLFFCPFSCHQPVKKFKKLFNFFCVQMKSKGLRNVGLIWNQMRQQRESGEMQAAAHFQSSSNSWLVKDLPASWGACSWHPRRRISTTSQHILHLLDQFYHHHCPVGRPKNQLMHLYSGHTFVN